MRHPRSLPPLVAVILILGLCCASNMLAQENPGAACEQARQAWLAANPLPTTYEQLLEVDPAHRNVALSALTPELRSAMWRRHLSDYLEANRYRLNDLQIGLIQRGMDLASPLFFRFPADSPGREVVDQAIADFRAQAASLFSEADASAIFVKIGGQADRLATGTRIEGQRLPNCNCQVDSDCTPSDCVQTFPRNCVFIRLCGFLGDETCTGLCIP
jgi:hypothetical protein